MNKSYQSFSKPLFYFTFALSVIIWILAIVLVVLLAVFGFIGFNNNTQLSTSCDSSTQSYYATKYNSNSTIIVQICFAFSIISLVFSSLITIILLVLLIKLAKDEIVSFRRGYKVVLYVSISLLVLSAAIPAGYYLSFWMQFPKCLLTSYNSSQIQTISIIALAAVALAFLLWFMYICCFYQRVSSEEKYIDVSSNPTEPNQKVQTYKRQEVVKKQSAIYATHQKDSPKHQVQKLQETNENLYQSPSKRKINYTYSRQPQQVPQRRRNYLVSETKGQLVHQDQGSKFTPQRSYKREPIRNDGQLVYMKSRQNQTFKKDEDTYKVYEQQYLGRNQGRSILPTSGVQEREKGSDYFRSVGEQPRRLSPSRMPEKQGVLVSYIRGKYAG